MAVVVDDRPQRVCLEHHSPAGDDTVKVVPTTDGELLRQFVCDQRDDAFTELVARHASMVLGVCRRILRDEHEAEDVFQATFLILANKARHIHRRHQASLATWLHRVAFRAALRTARSKHRKGKTLVDDVQSTELEQWLSIARQEEQLLLHEELNKLPKLYREAVVLCYLEGRSRAEAAKQLASTPEAVQKRVARGKQMLRMRLAKRGVAVAVALTVAAAPSACEAATLPSLVSLTSEICTATVLHADKTIYSTNVGHIAQQGAVSMKILTTPASMATTTAVVIGALFLLLGANGRAGDSAAAKEKPIVFTADRPISDHQPTAGAVTFVTQPERITRVQPGVKTALEGQWRLVAVETGGKPADPQDVPDYRLEFSGMKCVIVSGNRVTDCVVTIDPSKMPKWIDMHYRGGNRMTGIYELSRDTLKVSYGAAGNRPNNFKTENGSKQVIQTYQRVKS